MNKVRIGDLIQRYKEPIKVEDDVTYKQVTIRVKHKGVVLRGTQKGSAIGTKNQYIARQGQFILSRIDARQGAFGVVPPELEGAIITNDFWCFDINEQRVLRDFFYTLIQAPDFDEACKKASIGTTNRQRINEDFFLNYELEIPPLADQQAAVQQIAAARQHLGRIELELNYQTTLLTRMREAVLREAVQGRLVPQHAADEPATALLARINAEKQRLVKEKKMRADKFLSPLSETEIPYEVPQGWIWCQFGNVVINRDGERIPLESSVRQQRQGSFDYYGASGVIDKIDDFIFDKPLLLIGEDGANLINRSTPIAFIAEGKYWVNNHAHVVDALNFTTLRYLEFFFGSISLKPYITGTAQPKLNQAKLNLIAVPLPPLPEQRRIVAKVIELLAHCTELEAELLRAHQAAEALYAAALREAFRMTSTQLVYPN